MVREWVDLSGRVFDNGCGLGNYLKAFEQFGGQRFGLDVEFDRLQKVVGHANGVVHAVGEYLPFADNSFDVVFSNETIEHVTDDGVYAREMVRVTRPGGRILIFCPNRWYPVETHGIYWRGQYKFGNIPLINYLPNPIRNKLAPHVRAYTKWGLLRLFKSLPVRTVHYTRIFGGYDNIEYRRPKLGRFIKSALYTAEKTPFRILGISHLLVLEKEA